MFINKGIIDSKHPKRLEHAYKTARRVTTEVSEDDVPFSKATTDRIHGTSNNSDQRNYQKVKLYERYEDIFRSSNFSFDFMLIFQ